MNGYKTEVRDLLPEHLAGTPLGLIVPEEAREALLATSKAGPGRVVAILVDDIAAGFGLTSESGEVMLHMSPTVAGRGIGKSVAKILFARARAKFDRVWAHARPITAGEAIARHAGLAEVERKPGNDGRIAEVTLESIPHKLFHYTALKHLPAILKSSALVNRLVRLSPDDDDMKIAAQVFEDVCDSKTAIPGGNPTSAQREAWRTCIGKAAYDVDRLGMTCLSSDSNSDVLWNFPAPEEPSVSLELETEPLLEAARRHDQGAAFVRCLADEALQTQAVEALFDTMAVPPNNALSAAVAAYAGTIAREFAYRFVYGEFGGESEWRLLLNSGDRDQAGDVLLEGLRLSTVRLQPKQEQHLGAVVNALAAAGYTIVAATSNLITVAKR